jgi:hypothetical protein
MKKHVKLFEDYNNKDVYDIGDIVKVLGDDKNTLHDKYKNIELEVVSVATSPDDDESFDITIGDAFYRLKIRSSGEEIEYGLYDYELQEA